MPLVTSLASHRVPESARPHRAEVQSLLVGPIPHQSSEVTQVAEDCAPGTLSTVENAETVTAHTPSASY